MTFLPLFPLSLGGFAFLHAPGAAGAVFPPVGFGGKERPADSAAFPASPAQEAAGKRTDHKKLPGDSRQFLFHALQLIFSHYDTIH